MNDCSLLRDDLKAYLDGELPSVRRWTVRRHLSRCESCRREAQAIEQISRRLRAVPMEEFPSALRARILAKLPDAPPASASSRPKPALRWRPQPMVTWGAAAALLLAGLLIYPYFSPSPQMRQAAQSPLDSMAGGALSDDTMTPAERKASEQSAAEAHTHDSAPVAPAPSSSGSQSRAAAPTLSASPLSASPKRAGSSVSGSRAMPEAAQPGHKKTHPPAKPNALVLQSGKRDAPEQQTSFPAAGRARIAPRSADSAPQPKGTGSPDADTPSAGAAAPASPGALGGSAKAGESRTGQVETTRDLVPHQFQTDPLTELVLEVDNVTEKSLQLKQIVLKMGGAVAENNARRAAAPPDSAAFFLQIPSERYQEALEQIAALGTLAIPQTRAGVRRQETEDARSRQADGGRHRADRIDERDQNAPPENLLRRLMREASRGARADTNERRPDSPVTLRLLLREKPRP